MGGKQLLRRIALATPLRPVLLTEPRFVIVGTGRSGTRYISRLLRAAGIKCGHENWWTPDGTRTTTGLKGDASWLAAFGVADYAGHVFHQIRDPIRVIDSLLGWRLFDNDRDNDAYRIRNRYIGFTGDDKSDALLLLVTLVNQSERVSEWTWRVEDLSPLLLQHICERSGYPIDKRRAERAFELESNTYAHGRREGHTRLTWNDLPPSALKEEAMEIARRFGYF